MVLVDYKTLENPQKREVVKAFLIEHLISHPDTLITVLNAEWDAQPVMTKTSLKGWAFPFDGLAVNPLTLEVPPITFKTMFAASVSEKAEHKVVLVIDDEMEALTMWKNFGVVFTLSPEVKAA